LRKYAKGTDMNSVVAQMYSKICELEVARSIPESKRVFVIKGYATGRDYINGKGVNIAGFPKGTRAQDVLDTFEAVRKQRTWHTVELFQNGLKII